MSKQDILLSKSLSWLLRHGAVKEGLQINSDGYVPVEQILQHQLIRGKYDRNDIERVVKSNNKQRFKLRVNETTGNLEIKANQGHSIPDVNDTELTPILEPTYNIVVHGTYLKCWNDIKNFGLSRMQRKHIHLAKGTLEDTSIISGIRLNVEVYIFINLPLALKEGIKFFESENGVILTPGNKIGVLELKYFSKVIAVKTGKKSYMVWTGKLGYKRCRGLLYLL